MAKAPYRHSDGSDCWTKDCRLDNVKNIEEVNKAYYEKFETRVQELETEIEKEREIEINKILQEARNSAIQIATQRKDILLEKATNIVNTEYPFDIANITPEINPNVFTKPEAEFMIEGEKFTKYVDGVNFPSTPYQMVLVLNKEITDEEMNKINGLIGYKYRATIAGESLGEPNRLSPNAFHIFADTTKSQRDDLGMGFEDFHEGMNEFLGEGTPVRKTDRKGPGTKGTRLIDGIQGIKAEFYYDDII